MVPGCNTAAVANFLRTRYGTHGCFFDYLNITSAKRLTVTCKYELTVVFGVQGLLSFSLTSREYKSPLSGKLYWTQELRKSFL